MNSGKLLKPVQEDQKLANYIAMVVRNAMEDFHCEHLTGQRCLSQRHCQRLAAAVACQVFGGENRS